MEIHTLRKIVFKNIKEIVDEIERKFPVDPGYCDWRGRGEINIRCPDCTDRKYHMGLNFIKNKYNCYRCPSAGLLTSFLKKHHISFNSQVQLTSPQIQTEALKINIPTDFARDEKTAKIARKYLLDRGIDINFLLQNFKVWPITNSRHYYYGYIIMPLNDYAFYARKFLDIEALKNKEKHIIRKSDKTMKLFYAFEKNNSSTILVVESMFNLIKASQFGYDAVCIFGKEKWLSLIEYLRKRNNTANVCLCFDSDVKINNIEAFAKKIYKTHGNIDLTYIDPELMPTNDIAMINDKNVLIKLIKNKKNISDSFLNIMNLGDLTWGIKKS